MDDKKVNKLVAAGVLLVTLVVYLMTMSVTVVFWDVGEFIASSVLLQVPHPPGAPLFLLMGNVASQIPTYTDIAARVHALSALASALSIMLTYLVGVKLISHFRGTPSTLYDRLIVYGTSAIGALTLAFTTTYWANSIEAEVYGLSMLFVTLIIWLVMRWWEVSEEPHNEKYILLIAYLVGLSVGVHLLSVLAIFPVLMIVYFRRYEFTRKSFIQFSIIGLVVFFVIYPGVVQFLPSMLDGEFKGFESGLLPFIPPLAIIAAVYGIIRAKKTGHKMLQIACLSFLLIVLGYTTYLLVLMRANVDNMPMNENAPHDMAGLTSYLGREQYGDTPMLKGESWNNDQQTYVEKLFPRRWSREGMHEATRTNYTSDGDFFWRYQVSHMFLRYIGWNFIGAAGNTQDSGVSAKDTWAIPFLLAIIGAFYHFRKDWKLALVFMVMFIIMGVVLDLYQNQQEPQPRERDYFYVGAYYVMALWIMIGLVGLIDALRQWLKKESTVKAATVGALIVGFAVVPVNLLRVNWFEHNRSGEYIAWDYSYNLLQSCDANGILFTNGDNDTFPLWYLQDVEGVRRDVRIVNLSLVNTSWYVSQLKNQMPHGTAKVPISLTDMQIDQLEPRAWKPRQMDIPAPREMVEKYLSEDRPQQSNLQLSDSTALKQGKISFTLAGVPYQGDIRILRVQDLMTYDIIKTNRWVRPVHFAVTCSPDSKIGLDSYMWMNGLTYKLKPYKVPQNEIGIDYDIMKSNLMTENVTPSKTPQHGYLFRNLNNPKVYYDENVQRMIMNYRFNFIRLADYAIREKNNPADAKQIMGKMEQILPLRQFPMPEPRIMGYIMNLYQQIGDTKNYELYAGESERMALEMIDNNTVGDQQDPFLPYRTLVDIYDARKDYAAAYEILKRASAKYPNVPDLISRIQYYEQKMKEAPIADSGKTK
jgi:hypothetical protein